MIKKSDPHSDPSARQAGQPRRFGNYFPLFFLLLLLWAAAAFWAFSERKRVIAGSEIELARLNVAVEEQTLRLFKLVEATVVTMAGWIEEHPGVHPWGDPAFVAMTGHFRRLSDNAFEIRVIDPLGAAYLVPAQNDLPVANLATREHFKVQQNPYTRGLFVSDAVLSHVNGKWVVPVSYPVFLADGKTMTAVASIQLDRIASAFEMQRHQQGGSIVLLKTNGVTLFRAPLVEGAIGKSISSDPEFTEHLNARDRGQYRSESGVYGRSQRLISHSRLTHYPVIVGVTLELDEALQPWRNEIIRLFAILLAVSAAAVIVAYRFRHAENLALGRLAESEKRFRLIIEHAPDAIMVYDVDAKLIVDANVQAEILFSCSREELLSGGVERFYVNMQADGLSAEQSVERTVLRALAGESVVSERLVRTASGRELIFELRIEDMSENGRRLVRGSYYDITERKLAEKGLRESEARFRSLVETSPLPMLICGIPPENKVLLLNQRFVDVFGYSISEVRDIEAWWPLAYPDPDYRLDVQVRWQAAVDDMIASGVNCVKPICAEVRCKEGDQRYVEIHMTVETDHSLVVFNDLTERHANELQLDRIAHYDSLTGVANRALLGVRLHQAIDHARHGGDLLAVCYLDLDDFKPVNDTYGHAAGDRLLVEIAGRLQLCVRGGDTVGRLGGDEFVLLLCLQEVEECETALQRILAQIKQPVFIGGNAVAVSASIGVSLYPLDDSDPDTLLRHADQAMYEAKHAGKNQCRLFNPESDRMARKRRGVMERMQLALEQGELLLYYQPKVDMRRLQVIGVEALIRWQHPERGLLPPAEFLPHVEDSDLIVALGDWVLGETLRQSAAWLAEGMKVSVSVNIAARHLQQPDFVRRLEQHLALYPQLPARGHLELEVLETTALEDIQHISGIILACRALGVTFALDDFGTGYSSLSYLRRLPADSLKIDQSFVRAMLGDPEDLAIVEGIIRLAETFGRGVIAEGVESVEIGRALLGLGCSQAQGYGIARPMPAEKFKDWARSWPDQSWVNMGRFHEMVVI